VLLYGSFGTGDVDPWSDIDLVVFVADAVLPPVVADRRRFGDRFGSPLYVLDSTWNAPLAGAQVNMLYQLESGLPLYVDWNLWPLSMAARPEGTRLLFERSPGLIPPLPTGFEEWATYERQPGLSVDDVDDATLRCARFGMIPIAVKLCVRGQRTRLVRLLEGIGAGAVPEGSRGEMVAIRQHLTGLSQGQPPVTVATIGVMCDVAEEILGLS
jgi:hypothetical protein